MKTNEFLNKHPVFRRKEIEDFWQKEGNAKKQTVKQLLHYHKKKGHIIRIKNNLYAAIPPGRDPDIYPLDGFLIAVKATPDAVLGYHTALEFHGHAQSIHNRYIYFTNSSKHSFEFRNVIFKPVSFPAVLQNKNKNEIYVERVDRHGIFVNVTSLERTLVDLLNRPSLSGGWEEIYRSFEGVGYLNMQKVINYVKILENASTVARVGYFLEENKKILSVKENDLKELEPHIPKQLRYIDKGLEGGVLVKRWNLIVPEYIVNREWEE